MLKNPQNFVLVVVRQNCLPKIKILPTYSKLFDIVDVFFSLQNCAYGYTVAVALFFKFLEQTVWSHRVISIVHYPFHFPSSNSRRLCCAALCESMRRLCVTKNWLLFYRFSGFHMGRLVWKSFDIKFIYYDKFDGSSKKFSMFLGQNIFWYILKKFY